MFYSSYLLKEFTMSSIKQKKEQINLEVKRLFSELDIEAIKSVSNDLGNPWLIAEFERSMKVELGKVFRKLKVDRESACTDHHFADWEKHTLKNICGWRDYFVRRCGKCGLVERFSCEDYPDIEKQALIQKAE